MKVAKVAAVVAAAGIVVAILVIGTPAFTTLRIAARSLASPTEGASWMDFQMPARSEVQRAIARNPDGWKLRLVLAKRLFVDGASKSAPAEAESQGVSMRTFEQLVADRPQVLAVRSGYAGWLYKQPWDFVHPIHVEIYAKMPAGAPGVQPYEAHVTERADLVAAAERELAALTELDPDNAAWPFMRAYCRFAHLDDARAFQYIRDAAQRRHFSVRHKRQTDAARDAYARMGVRGPEARLRLEAETSVGELARLLDLTKIACGLADKMEAKGRLTEAAEVRMALIDFGRLMWHTSDDIITGLIGHAITAMGYGNQGIELVIAPTATDEERRAAHADWQERVEAAFTAFLHDAGKGEEAPRYAHGLREGRAYNDAVGIFLESPAAQAGQKGWQHLGIAYGPAPVAWLALLMTAVAFLLIGGAMALARGKATRASGKAIVGVSLAGGVVCLALLALSVFLTRAVFGQGFLQLDAGPPGFRYTLPPVALGIGIAFAILVTAWALRLVLRSAISRSSTAVFGAASLLLAAGYWVYVWLETVPSGPNWQGLWLIWHLVLAIVSIGGIAAVLRVWLRQEAPRVSTAVPILAGVANFAIFCVLFLSIGENLGSAGMIFLIASVPAAVAIGALVTKIVAVGRLRPGDRPTYLAVLRPALAVCLAWLLVLQFASLIWLGAWRAKAAREIEEHYAVSENQAVLRIMEESGGVNESQ